MVDIKRENTTMPTNLKREVLLYFKTDAITRGLYQMMKTEYGIEKSVVQKTFLALKSLGYLKQTNPHGSVGATFCITKSGRELLEYEYGISLAHPDSYTIPFGGR